ncbi:unnamed protein product [Laminaria digitata]
MRVVLLLLLLCHRQMPNAPSQWTSAAAMWFGCIREIHLLAVWRRRLLTTQVAKLPHCGSGNGPAMCPPCRVLLLMFRNERKSGNMVQGQFLVHSAMKARVVRCARTHDLALFLCCV